MGVTTPLTTATTTNTAILANALRMPIISRFHYLLKQTKALVHTHGPYMTYTNTTVLARSTSALSKPYGPSSKCMAFSLAAAQDCIGSAQIPGPAKEDLHIFKHLWDTTIELLEDVLLAGDLDHEAFGWGIWGLCAGYMYPPWEASFEVFEEHKHRLHQALLALPSVDSERRLDQQLLVSGEGRLEMLVSANRQVHICASLVLQRFRQEGWHRIRWWHGVKIADRWIAKLGLEDEVESIDDVESIEQEEGRESLEDAFAQLALFD